MSLCYVRHPFFYAVPVLLLQSLILIVFLISRNETKYDAKELEIKCESECHQLKSRYQTHFRNDGRVGRDMQQTRLFSTTSMDANTSRLVHQLQSLPIFCSSRSSSHQISMSNVYTSFLQNLSSYIVFHADNKRDGKKMVWYCGNLCGGLGDRLRGLTYALMLAMASQRVLLIEWYDSKPKYKTFLKPNVINWQLTEEEKLNIPLANHHSIMCAGGNKGLNSSLPINKLASIYAKIAGNTEWVYLKTNMFPGSLVFGEMEQSTDWIRNSMVSLGLSKLTLFEVNKLVGITFRYLFNFTDEIVSKIKEYRNHLKLSNLAYVGVHIRNGSGFYLENNFTAWNKILECAHKKATDKHTIMFLASDSFCMKNAAILAYNATTCLHKVMHNDRPSRTDNSSGVVSMWVDLVLLAESETIVMPRSGYSFLASSLCLLPTARVVHGETCKPLDFLSR